MAVTHFLTEFTHVSRHFEAYSRKNVEGKLFWKCGLRNLPERLVLSSESAKDLDVFMVFQFYFYSFLHFFLKWVLWTHRLFFLKLWDQFSIQFSLNNFFLFSTLNSKMSKNWCKLRHKLRNGQNLPHESPNFTNYFFLCNFTHNFGHFSTSLRPHYINSFSK